MRFSQLFLPTIKETPSDAELVSHQYMLRAGLIRKVAAGVYTWLPLGFKVMKKVEAIVREEMLRIGAQEVLLPAVHPAELWQETGRWDQYGRELLKLTDRHEREFCFGPTHEEIITDLVRREIRSYKQLPFSLFQIQTKFRDEIRPRFGVMRAREFIMKDAYSFHTDTESLQKTYEDMYTAYCRIFARLGLDFRPVKADTGSIGGSASHEFQVLAQSGEDVIAISDSSDYAANIEMAEAMVPTSDSSESLLPIEKVQTPGARTIADVCQFLKIDPKTTVKALLVKGSQSPVVALVLRGDHELNVIKAEKCPEVAKPLTFADSEMIESIFNCQTGYIGPCASPIPVIADRDAAVLTNFVCGANETNAHLINVNWNRDAQYHRVADLRNVVEGDVSPDGKGHLKLVRGIEVGHIFQLGQKYSHAMNAVVLDEQGKDLTLEMGCYGIGVTRIVAAAIEQHHDEKGIIWPKAMAPFQVVIIAIHGQEADKVNQTCEQLYQQFHQAGLDVLLDDREERPGVKFADADLIGIPQRLVVSPKTLAQQAVEYKTRTSAEVLLLPIDDIISVCLKEV